MRNSTFMKSLFALTMGWMAVANAQAGTPFKAEGNKIPGTIEAEDYDKDGWDKSYKWNRTDFDTKKNSGGNYREDYGVIGGPQGTTRWLGEMDGGVWTIYTVTVEEDGDYDLTTYYAKGNDGTSSFTLTFGTDNSKTVTLPGSGAWEDFSASVKTAGIHLTKGTYEMKFETGGGFNVDKFVFVRTGEISKGHGMEIPGRIEAEEFDDGGDNVAYHWNDGNEGGAGYRTDAIHIGNGGTGHNIGWTANGDWALYTVNVKEAGEYVFTYNVSSGNDNDGSFRVEDANGNSLTGEISFRTTGWDNYVTYTLDKTITLEAGVQTLKWVCGGGMNIDYFEFTLKSANNISTVKAQTEDNAWYNLQGQRVAQPAKGLYIQNGKKFIVK